MNTHLKLEEVHHYTDNRPRYMCLGCGKVTKKNITESAIWEHHTCAECGYRQNYRTK